MISTTLDCKCNINGSKSTSCDSNGKCTCKENVIEDKCDTCKAGYFPFPDCDKGKVICIKGFFSWIIWL